MRRRLLKFAAAVSLLLFLAMVALWMRSYQTHDEIRHDSITDTDRDPTPLHCRRIVVWSAWGGIVVIVERRELGRGDATKPEPGWRYLHHDARPYPSIRSNPFTLFDRCGIQLFNRAQRRGVADPQLMARIPYWLVILLLPLPLLAFMRALRMRSRSRQGLCP